MRESGENPEHKHGAVIAKVRYPGNRSHAIASVEAGHWARGLRRRVTSAGEIRNAKARRPMT